MRKVFLETLPQKQNGNIDWKSSSGYIVAFIYDDYVGNFKILSYDSKSQFVELWCENKIYELFEIIQHEEIRQRNLYYLYIEDWCDSRNVSVEDVDEETGINGGECYACFSEFCDNEYLDEDYMLELEKNLD